MVTQKALIVLLLVSLTSILSQVGIIFHNNILKYLSLVSYLLFMIMTFSIILNNYKKIYLRFALPLIFVLFLYPFSGILINIFGNFSLKTLSDGLIIKGGYYQLMLTGLSLALLTNRIDKHKLLFQYSLVTLPIGLILIVLSMTTHINIAMNIGFLAFTNVLIPMSLLAFYTTHKKSLILGWVALILMLFVSSYLGSRSYNLVSIYFVLALLLYIFRTRKKLALKIVFALSLFYILGGFSFFTQTSSLREQSIAERYQIDSLLVSIDNYLEDGDLLKLFMWEGNSRAIILVDAFHNFSFDEWLFGKGIAATYQSFIVRSTIEIAWAQETFRWGLLYVLFLLISYVKSYRNLKKSASSYNDKFFYVIAITVMIKILDGFIYGMPSVSIYDLLVFWGVMLLGVKKTHYTKESYNNA